MRFYAWVEGTGYGCDYTIGCNTTVVELKATTKADALIEAASLVEHFGEDRVDAITVLSDPAPIDVRAEKQRIQTARDREEATLKERRERDTLQQLMRKYGSPNGGHK